MNIQNSRILTKRSTTGGVVPTIPASDDHTDGSWLTTDIYKGELFINIVDNKTFTRTDSGIVQILMPTSGFQQGGNSFTAAATLGTNDLYDLLFETNNVSRQLIDSTGRFGFGTTSLSASTHKTNKSQGNTSAGWAEKWLDSDNALIASLDNNGLFSAYGGLSTDGVASIFSDTTNNRYFIGGNAGNSSTGVNNVFVGNNTGSGSTDDYLVGFGTNALLNSTGDNKNSFGIQSGQNSDGSNCNFFGTSTGDAFSGDYADFFGFAAGQDGSGNRKIGFGIYAGRLNTDSNVAIFADYYDIYFNHDIARDALGTSTHAVTLQTGGSKAGTNESAAASIMKFASARGTGNADSGDLQWLYSAPVASGTTRQSLALAATMDGATGNFKFEKIVNLSLTDYADNAAAITGGLSVGDLYRTSGAVKIVI